MYLCQLRDSKLIVKYVDTGVFDARFYQAYHKFVSQRFFKRVIYKISKNRELIMARDELIKFKVNNLRCHLIKKL